MQALKYILLPALILVILASAHNSGAEERKWALIFKDGIVAHWDKVTIFKEEHKICKDSEAQMCVCMGTLEDAVLGSVSEIPPVKLIFHPKSGPIADKAKKRSCGSGDDLTVAFTQMEKAFETTKSKFELNKIVVKVKEKAIDECKQSLSESFKRPQVNLIGSEVTDYSHGVLSFVLQLQVHGASERGIAECKVSYDFASDASSEAFVDNVRLGAF